MRQRLGLRPGAKLTLFTDQNQIMLKPILTPDISAFNRMAVAARKVMERVKTGRHIASG